MLPPKAKFRMRTEITGRGIWLNLVEGFYEISFVQRCPGHLPGVLQSFVWWKGRLRWQFVSSAKCVLMISLSRWEHLTEIYCWSENKLVSIGGRWSPRDWTFNIVPFILFFPLKGPPTSLILPCCQRCRSHLHFGGRGWWGNLPPPPTSPCC